MKAITIGSAKAIPGKTTSGTLSIADNKHELHVTIMQGTKDGPTALVVGGAHGNEINGPGLVQQAMAAISPDSLSGTVVFIPLMNVSGFIEKTRNVVENDSDLNRSYSPEGGKGLSFSIAKELLENVIPQSDFVIDCHDLGSNWAGIPHVRVHVNESGVCNDGCTVDIGKLFGTEIVVERKGDDGMMAIEINKQLGIPVLTVELGGGMQLWDDYIKTGVRGIKNLLISNKMLEGTIALPKSQLLVHMSSRASYETPDYGLLTKPVPLGESIHAGDIIATVTNPATTKKSDIVSKQCGILFTLKTQDNVRKDERIASIIQTQTCQIHNTKPVDVSAI